MKFTDEMKTVYFVIMDDLHGPFPPELDPYKLETNS